MSESIGIHFMEHTKYDYLEEESDQTRGMPQPPLEVEYDLTKSLIDLVDPQQITVTPTDLREAIEQRKSLRKYAEKAFTKEEFSYLLWTTQGVKKQLSGRTRRNVPSAGARHAFETYILVNQVEELDPGLYRYLALEHKLVQVNMDSDIAEKITEACLGQTFVKNSGATFIWVAVPYRMKWRYDERAYRYLHLDAGHVCQNLYLAAESIQCGACAIAAFDDNQINQLLGLDGIEQFVIYIGTAGKK